MFRLAQIGIVVLLVVGAVGCATNRQPRYQVEEPYSVVPFKRYAQHDQVDYWHRFSGKAYEKLEEPLDTRLSDDQENVLNRHGMPDYLREQWRSRSGEILDEWIWWDRGVVTQFVQGQLVYEGETTDMDRYRVRHGYPQAAWTQKYQQGVRRNVWDYAGFLQLGGHTVTFTDEQLISTSDY